MEAKTCRPMLLWLAILGSLLASGYAFMSSVYYAWMSAMGTPVPERATAWAYVALGLSVVFFVLSIYFIVCLHRCYTATRKVAHGGV
jgi:uncharacterized membrane protein YidH (DUF202 family)